ncbi:MAG: TrkA C-terminal domain-containing protein [Actinomycetaceae bacterium]|nr:TrkA C-terminal domain-containing protein [Actinomycetaceae bacterium]MDY6083435.1 TrkA C-terminal domain-containing protein [Actinomycetaceae bacterium]
MWGIALTSLLIANPLLALFVVVALGAALGLVPFGPLRFGAAGALFVGLVIGHIAPDLAQHFATVQSLGLALFVYTVGLSAGQTFFTNIRKQANLMFASMGVLVIGGITAIIAGRLLGTSGGISAGVYAGTLTTTPALAAATAATHGSGDPGVGYSLGYPVGVTVAIVLVSVVVSRRWPGNRDVPSLAGQSLSALTVIVSRTMPVREVPGWQQQKFKISYLQREGQMRVYVPGSDLREGDHIVIVGQKSDVDTARKAIGKQADEHLANYRAAVDFQQFVVSSKDIAGKTVVSLNLMGKFGATMTRIHRGDIELLATDDTVLELGDRVFVALPQSEYEEVGAFFGNSERRISEVDALSLGIGMALGLLLGMVEITLPGGSTFSLGAAAGPLIVGMILGALHKTGPLLWQMPQAANQTIRQLGLLLFLAAVGIGSGEDFMRTVRTRVGAMALVLALIVVLVVLLLAAMICRLLGFSAQRAAGVMAGILGQPAILAFASNKVNDERIEAGYATVFAFGIIVKIVMATVIVAFG